MPSEKHPVILKVTPSFRFVQVFWNYHKEETSSIVIEIKCKNIVGEVYYRTLGESEANSFTYKITQELLEVK